MKKFLIVMITLVALAFVGCAEPSTPMDRVTYLQTVSLYGQEGTFRICIRTGTAEKKPVADGVKGETANFATANLRVLEGSTAGKTYGYRFKLGDKDYTGEFVQDRFGTGFSADLGEVPDLGMLTAITIVDGESETTVPLENMMADLVITYDKALERAVEELKTDLDAEEQEGFVREIHVKFINDGHNPDSKYYWYVAFIREDAQFWAVLVDPETGDVVAKRK